MSRPLTVSLERILEMRERGVSQSSIARILGVHRTTILYHLKCCDANPQWIHEHQKKLNRDREIARLYMEDRLSARRIADRLGMCHKQINRILHRQPGVTMRAKRKPSPSTLPPVRPVQFSPVNISATERSA